MKRPGGRIDVDRVDLDDGDWLEFRTRMTAGDSAAMQRAGVHVVMGEESNRNGHRKEAATSGVEFDFGASNIACIVVMTVAWGGPAFCVIDHEVEGAGPHHEGVAPCKSERICKEFVESWDSSTMMRVVTAINERISRTQPQAVEESSNP